MGCMDSEQSRRSHGGHAAKRIYLARSITSESVENARPIHKRAPTGRNVLPTSAISKVVELWPMAGIFRVGSWNILMASVPWRFS